MEKIHGRNQRFRKKRHAKKSIDVLEDGLTDESRVNCQDVEGRDSSGQGSSKKKSSATRGKVSFEKKKFGAKSFNDRKKPGVFYLVPG